MKIKTRFAPSPTGLLHVGNVRTALTAWLFARKYDGEFVLRIDDTDVARSTKEFETQIIDDLKWLGLNWDYSFNQSNNLSIYKEAFDKLVSIGRIYPCYETPEELDLSRNILLKLGKPPIYDRSSLKLSADEIKKFEAEGRKPHYRFKIDRDQSIAWHDLVRGELRFEGANLSDPVVVRADGSMTYILCSAIDDINHNITHIIRGEDHISNTAIQVDMIRAFEAYTPKFAHLSLIQAKDAKISKSKGGGFDIKSLREEGFEAMAIHSLFSKIGTSMPVEIRYNLQEIIDEFVMNDDGNNVFSKAPATYDKEDLLRLNHKIVAHMSKEDARNRLSAYGIDDIGFFDAVKGNLNYFHEVKLWWDICKGNIESKVIDSNLLKQALEILPKGPWDANTWKSWTDHLKTISGKNGKDLYMPLRLAITGLEHGPELKYLLPLIGFEQVTKRLSC